ncbi:MAG TPA: PTS mannose/fructose/sorbose transporter subunit IIB [bacterium]|nr:PTS mannose/fructose/sorbose transporter subunit IIB [bacterium]
MPILLARIDDRLIHGQVVVGWAQSLKADHIVVINDDVVKNEMQKFLFRMATPNDIKLSVLSVVETADKINKREFDDDCTILLARTPADFYRLISAGGKLGEINIGGMHFAESKVQLFDAIFVDAEDVAMLEKLAEMGVLLEVRMVPTDSKKNVIKAINEKFHKRQV